MIADLCILGCIGAALAVMVHFEEVLEWIDRRLDGRHDGERRDRIAACQEHEPQRRVGFVWIVGTDTRYAREVAQLRPKGVG